MSDLIGVFGGDEKDEPYHKPIKKKSSAKPKDDYKKDDLPQNTNSMPSNLGSVFGGDEDDEPSKQTQSKKKYSNKPKVEGKNGDFSQNNNTISSNLASVFADSDEEKKQESFKKKSPKKPKEQNQPSQNSQNLQSNLISVLGYDSEEDSDKIAKKNKAPSKPQPDYDTRFGPKPYDKPNKSRRNKRNRRREQQHPSDRDPDLNEEAANGNGEDDDNGEFHLKSEKPTLIKTLNPDNHGETEIALETFLQQEYQDYVLKPADQIQHLSQEDDYGNVEYKLKLTHPNPERVEQLTTQMKFRLQEGNGEAKYQIGVEDDGTPKGLNQQDMFRSLKTLCLMASALKADVVILQMRDGYEGKLAELLVRSNQKDGIKLDIKIMLLGDKQSGKSTLIGVLTSGLLDNGNGAARMQVHVHKHEVLTGETSSLSHHIMGFDSQGNVTNHTEYGHPSWEQIVDMSTKVLTFLDIGGHEKYTTKIMSSLCSFYPDYALIVISAAKKVTPVTEQHLKLACIFEIPITIVITHVDLITEGEIYALKSEVERAIRKFSEDKYLVVANNEEDNVIFSRTLKEKLVIPVFMISNVDGTNLDLFKSFLNLLPVNNPLSTNIHLHSEFYIHAIFHKKDQLILGGTVINGCINKNQGLFLGPDEKGNFRYVEVANIQCKKVPVKSAYCGQSCTIEVKLENFAEKWPDFTKDSIRRGMVLVDTKSEPKAAFQFTAEISLLEEKVAKAILWEGYEPVVTSQTTHQACVIDFEDVEAEEMTEEDLQKLKQTNNEFKEEEIIRKGSLTKSVSDKVADRKLRSKSEDFKDVELESKTFKAKNLIILPGDIKDNNLTNKIKSEDVGSDFEESKGLDVYSEDENKSQKDNQSDIASPKLSVTKEGEGNQKMTFQEKIKRIKRTIHKDVEELVSKKRKRKFIGISSDEGRVLKFKFKYHPEYIVKGQKIIINDSSMKAIGIIKDVIYIDPMV